MFRLGSFNPSVFQSGMVDKHLTYHNFRVHIGLYVVISVFFILQTFISVSRLFISATKTHR